MNVLNKFRLGLKKSSNFFTSNLIDSLKSKKLDSNLVEQLENALLTSDVSLEVASHLIHQIESKKNNYKNNIEEIIKILANEIEKILLDCEKEILNFEDTSPTIFIFIGVNGSGKTTTIGKLIKYLKPDNKILVAGCDTFRAAAVDQIKEWSIRENADFFEGQQNQDPASVAYTACEKAISEKYNYLIIDTAGRLSNNTNLLNQLIKIKSVSEKSAHGKTIKTILVLDGTNGSNMINQVEIFNKNIGISGLIITKLDGTAKGGALISIAQKYKLPIHFVGLGEKNDDLVKFNAKQYAKSLLNIEDLK